PVTNSASSSCSPTRTVTTRSYSPVTEYTSETLSSSTSSSARSATRAGSASISTTAEIMARRYRRAPRWGSQVALPVLQRADPQDVGLRRVVARLDVLVRRVAHPPLAGAEVGEHGPRAVHVQHRPVVRVVVPGRRVPVGHDLVLLAAFLGGPQGSVPRAPPVAVEPRGGRDRDHVVAHVALAPVAHQVRELGLVGDPPAGEAG